MTGTFLDVQYIREGEKTLELTNPVTLMIIILCAAPLLSGILRPFYRNRVRYSLASLLDNVEFLAAVVISAYLTNRIFFDNQDSFFATVYGWIPENAKKLLEGQTVTTYIVATPIIMIFVLLILRLFTTPLYSGVIIPVSDAINLWIRKQGIAVQRLMGTIWQLPKAICLPLIFVLLVNISTYFLYIPPITDWINSSKLYGIVYDNSIDLMVNSNLAKSIPVLSEDSFRNLLKRSVRDNSEPGETGSTNKKSWDIKVIRYFNGVTLDKAVESNAEINGLALKVAGKHKDDKGKAYALYKWVSGNIEYDYGKSEDILNNPFKYESGAIPAFETRQGICFDYSSLYVAMCRAAGLKVRIITGVGYSGNAWGDHAWNQVYLSSEKRWVNVDTTFGSSGVNYFDRPNFGSDHKNGEVQGEW